MDTAILAIIIFAIVVALFIWNKWPIAVTALIGLIAMILFGVIDFNTAFKNFGSSTVLLICSMMIVGKAAFDTGLAQVVGKKVIGLAKDNERMIIIIATAITGLVSAFLSDVATLAIMISIIITVCATKKNIHFMNIILPVGMAAVIGGAATLVGSTPQLTSQGLLEDFLGAGNGFSFFTFAIPGFIIILLLVLYAGFIGYPLGKKIWGKRPEYFQNPTDDGENETKIAAPNQKKMRIMIVIFIATIIAFILTDQIKLIIPEINIGIIALMSALSCILTGCISFKEAIKSVNWNLAIWFCSCLGLAGALNVSGGAALIANGFISLFGENIAPFVLYGAFLLLIIVLTQFLSNSTVLAIILPIVFSVTAHMGFNTFSFTVGLTMAAMMAVATPLANATIGMTMVAKYKFTDYVKYAGPMTLIAMGVLLFLVPVLYPLV